VTISHFPDISHAFVAQDFSEYRLALIKSYRASACTSI